MTLDATAMRKGKDNDKKEGDGETTSGIQSFFVYHMGDEEAMKKHRQRFVFDNVLIDLWRS